MTRTKYFRRKLERMTDDAARTWISSQRPELSEAMNSVHIRPGSDVHLKWIRDWAAILAGALLDRSWFVARPIAGQFITSDNPVYGIAGRTDALDVGVLAATEIRYPVDSATALVWTPAPGHDAAIFSPSERYATSMLRHSPTRTNRLTPDRTTKLNWTVYADIPTP